MIVGVIVVEVTEEALEEHGAKLDQISVDGFLDAQVAGSTADSIGKHGQRNTSVVAGFVRVEAEEEVLKDRLRVARVVRDRAVFARAFQARDLTCHQ